jgi:hypothetical protein
MDVVEVALCGHMFLAIGRKQPSMDVIRVAITRMAEGTAAPDWYMTRPKT